MKVVVEQVTRGEKRNEGGGRLKQVLGVVRPPKKQSFLFYFRFHFSFCFSF
jgi:hypothetical protein